MKKYAVSSPVKKPSSSASAGSSSSAAAGAKKPSTAATTASPSSSATNLAAKPGKTASSIATPTRPGTSSSKTKEQPAVKKPSVLTSTSAKTTTKSSSSSPATKPKTSKSSSLSASSQLKQKSGKSPLASKESLKSSSKTNLTTGSLGTLTKSSQEVKTSTAPAEAPTIPVSANPPAAADDQYEDDFEQYGDDFEEYEDDKSKAELKPPPPAIVVHESEPVVRTKTSPENAYEEDFEQYESDFESYQEDEKSSHSQKSTIAAQPSKPVKTEMYRLVPTHQPTQMSSIQEQTSAENNHKNVLIEKKKPAYTGKMISCKRWLELKKYIEFEESRTVNMLDIIYGRDNTTNKFYNLQPRQTQFPSLEGEEADIREISSQTEKIEAGDKWTQMPAGFSLFANDSGVPLIVKAKDRFKAPPKPKIRDYQTLNRFVMESGNLLENLWNEERYGTDNGDDEEQMGDIDHSVAGLSTHFTPINMASIIENRQVLDIAVSKDYIMVSLSRLNGYASVALFSRINFQLVKVLQSGSQINCFYSNSSVLPDFVIGGADDGSLVVWDISSKKSSSIYPVYVRYCDGKGTYGHLDSIRLLELYGDSNSYLELCSFDTSGKAIIWRIVMDGDSSDFGCSYGHQFNLIFVTLLNVGSRAVRLQDGSFACSDGSEGSLHRLNRYNSRTLPLAYQTWFSSFGRKCSPAVLKPLNNSTTCDFLVAFIEGYVASYNKDVGAVHQVWFVDFSSYPKGLEISPNLRNINVICDSDIYIIPADVDDSAAATEEVNERAVVMPWSKEGLPGADTTAFRKTIWTKNLFSEKSSRMLVWIHDEGVALDRVEWHTIAS